MQEEECKGVGRSRKSAWVAPPVSLCRFSLAKPMNCPPHILPHFPPHILPHDVRKCVTCLHHKSHHT
eukprot:363758-Chlamydomonas_euryale.AAC.1